jgi:hypothetical protein
MKIEYSNLNKTFRKFNLKKCSAFNLFLNELLKCVMQSSKIMVLTAINDVFNRYLFILINIVV